MKFITWVFKFTPWGVSQGGWGGGSPPTSLGGLSGVLQGTITTHPPAAPFSWERGLPEVQTPTPLQGLHTCSVKGHPWNGSHSGHGCACGVGRADIQGQGWVAGPPMPGGHLVGQWAVASFPGPLPTVFVNFSNKSKLTSFHEFKWWGP